MADDKKTSSVPKVPTPPTPPVQAELDLTAGKSADNPVPPDPKLDPETEALREKIFEMDEPKQDFALVSLNKAVANGDQRAAAYSKIRDIALSFQPTAEDEHIVFGAAGIRYTLGDLRDLVGLPRHD